MNDAVWQASFGLDWLMYVIPGVFLHLFIFVIWGIGIAAYAVVRKETPKLRNRLLGFGYVLLILAPIAGLFNATWCRLVAGNLYIQDVGIDGAVLDVDSPQDDFTPFIPPSHHWLAGLPGHLVGTTMPQLQLVWFFFAATAWAISFIVYRIIKRKIVPAVLALSRPPLAVEPSHA